MEADLHAIVSFLISLPPAYIWWLMNISLLDPFWPAIDRCPFPIFHLSNPLWPEIHPLSQCFTP